MTNLPLWFEFLIMYGDVIAIAVAGAAVSVAVSIGWKIWGRK